MCKIWLQKSETQGQQERLVDKDTATKPDDLSSIPRTHMTEFESLVLKFLKFVLWHRLWHTYAHTFSSKNYTHTTHTHARTHTLSQATHNNNRYFLRNKRIGAKYSNSCMIEYLTSVHEFLNLTSTMARKNKKEREKSEDASFKTKGTKQVIFIFETFL